MLNELGRTPPETQADNVRVPREVPVFWALVVSQLGFAAVVTFLFQHAGVRTPAAGLKTSAIFGFLLGTAIAFDLHAVTN